MAPGSLERLLRASALTMPEPLQKRFLAGTAHNEDAAVLHIPAGKAIVQTVDLLTPIVNDPFAFGRIAAANALSDVYALGGEPWCAMNIACFPPMCSGEDIEETLAQILRGGQSAMLEAGAAPAGGHTVQDEELKYGLAVTGLIDPGHIAVNSGLEPGMHLVLTKPLGTGILATAVKAGWEGADKSEQALAEVCGRLNKAGATAIRTLHLTAATDITGFGLGGHARELAQASDVSIAINTRALPLLPRAVDYARDGLIPAGSHTNRQYCQCVTRVEAGVDEALESIVFDAQTSGGLLLGVPQQLLAEAGRILEEAGDLACDVGEVLPPRDDGIRLILR